MISAAASAVLIALAVLFATAVGSYSEEFLGAGHVRRTEIAKYGMISVVGTLVCAAAGWLLGVAY